MAWNTLPPALLVQQQAPPKGRSVLLLASATLLLLAAQWSPVGATPMLSMLLQGVAALLLAFWVHGLLACTSPARPAPAAAAPVAAAPKTPVSLGPPLRGGRSLVVAPLAGGAEPSPATTMAPSSAGRPSPYGRGVVTTPEQLRRLLDDFEEGMASPAAASQAEPGFSPASAGVRLGGASTSLGPGPVYRPSAVPKGKAAVPVATDGKVGPSSLDSKQQLLARLHVSERSLEAGTERLREWMAARALKPLVKALDFAHTNVIETAARIGWQGVQLQPLESQSGQRNRADDEAVVAQMREQLVARMRSLGSLQPPAEATCCLEAVNAHQRLSQLLRGEYLPGLLPPTPQGYIAARIRELAEGSCMAAYAWNAGGDWGGKPWSAELPTDSALVFYLFASYLAAPQWLFPQSDASAISGLSGTLYLGKLPSKPADGYVGVLSARPPPTPKGTAVVGLQLGTQQPLFSLVVAGESVYAASGSLALLQVLLLFLQLSNQELDGSLGGRHLHHLDQLDRVLKERKPRYGDMVQSAARLLARYL